MPILPSNEEVAESLPEYTIFCLKNVHKTIEAQAKSGFFKKYKYFALYKLILQIV